MISLEAFRSDVKSDMDMEFIRWKLNVVEGVRWFSVIWIGHRKSDGYERIFKGGVGMSRRLEDSSGLFQKKGSIDKNIKNIN